MPGWSLIRDRNKKRRRKTNGGSAVKKIECLLIGLIAVLALSVDDSWSRGFGGGGSRGGGSFREGGGGERFGGGGIRHIAPSADRPHIPEQRFRREEYSKPNLSGRQMEQRRDGNRLPSQGRNIRPDQTFRNKPTQGQVQDFLKLPKTNVNQTKPGIGKIGAAALGVGAGAMALDHFAGHGRPIDPAGMGHQPSRIDRPGQRVNPQTAQLIRNNYSQRYHNMFNNNWWGQHANLNRYYWHNNIWPHHPWNYWWRPATWIGLSSWIAWNWGPPLFYNYGYNFYYDNGFVYLDGRRLCSANEYYDQAVQTVSRVPDVGDDAAQWMPLGVFALSLGDSASSNMVVQLAVNKDGVIQGTYYNTDNDVTKPIKGMVDKQSQRAVWTFADDNNTAVIMETGVYNLTQDQTQVLVHFGKDRTEEWLMVRLEEPPSKEKESR
jgi:hypothetical protein